MKLDNKESYHKEEQQKVAKAIAYLPDQVRQALTEVKLIKMPVQYKKASCIVVNGMGGSNIGARIVKHALADKIKTPIIVSPGYEVPSFVNKKTLYIVSSYSGNTEEPLNAYYLAKKRGAMMAAITTDSPKNRLAKLMLKNNIPGYLFNPRFNPSKQPRYGLGYAVFGIIGLIAKSGHLTLPTANIKNIIAEMEIRTRRLSPTVKQNRNKAKEIASLLVNKLPVLVAAEHLKGNIHALRNQLDESSKLFSCFLPLPDLNHFAMEGLSNPKKNKKSIIFLFFESDLYHHRNKLRFKLTKQVITDNKVSLISHTLKSKSRLGQAFELLQFGSWLSFYLSIVYNVNPEAIPWVNWFKKQLKQ